MPNITDSAARSAKPQAKAYRLKDEHGLYLEIRPSGMKSWRLRCYNNGKEGIVTIGEYPLMSCKEARAKRDEIRKKLMEGAVLSEISAPKKATVPTFADIAREWVKQQEKNGNRAKKFFGVTNGRLNTYVFPEFGDRPINEITPLDLLRLVQKIRDFGMADTARRVNSLCGQIFRYAILLGVIESDPTYALRGSLPPVNSKHFASIQDAATLGRFYNSIGFYTGSETIRAALKYLVLTFPRPKELRFLEWSEIDWGERIIRISAEKMKMRRPHIVPLADQVLALLKKQKEVSGNGIYVFPSPRNFTGTRVMSDAALVVAMRAMGYEQDEVCAHGFRHTASTMLNESGLWSGDAIERQLAHMETNKIRGTYNAAEYIEERRRMMQWWADRVESLAEEAKAQACAG